MSHPERNSHPQRNSHPERSEGSARVHKYFAFAALGFRQARAEPGELLGRVLFFALILGVFSAVWRAVAEAGASVQLTPLEFRILYILAMNEGRVIPYSRLVDYVWGYEGGRSNLLKTHICHLRKKLGMSTEGRGSIRSVCGVGYSLTRA